MKEALVETLKMTLIGDTQKLSDAHNVLLEMAKSEGFCLTLMQIVDDVSINIPTKQAGLIQLKNVIRGKWKGKVENMFLTQNQKSQIRSTLVTAVIRCAKSQDLIKLYRQIITIIVSYEYQHWLPLTEIRSYLERNENISPSLQCLIAVATSFELSINQKEKETFQKISIGMFPIVFNLVKQHNTNWEIIYLATKYFWKSIHSEICLEVKMISLEWMELFHHIITFFNEDLQKHANQFQQKQTPEFYYFHTKKWATRIILRYLQKHTKAMMFEKELPEEKVFSANWHQNYGGVFLKAIIEQISIPTIKKVRHFQFKCLQNWVLDKPGLVRQYSRGFQYQILPKYLRLKPEDESLAANDPIEYLSVEEECSLSFTNLKRAATELWVAFTQMESKSDHKTNSFTPGPLFNENFEYLVNNLASTDLIEKQMSMYLLCELRYTIIRIPEAKKFVPELFMKYIINELQSNVMLMRMRANDMFTRYGRGEEMANMNLISMAAQGIFLCLSSDKSPLVRIKAASAFHSILKHSYAKELVKPKLKDILQIYLKLIEQYDLEQLVYGLERIVEDFAPEIGPYAVEMFKYLSEVFIKLFYKDIEQNNSNNQYEGETEIAAAGCLKTMAQIVQAPLSSETRRQIEAQVLKITYFVFTEESVEYSEQIFGLLNSHLYRVEEISPELWLFYQTTIYFLVGIPEGFWKQIEGVAMPEKQKKLLMSIRENENLEYFQHAVPVLRNFMCKGAPKICLENTPLRSNFIHVMFYLIREVYKNFAQGQSESQTDLDCCTVLLIYWLETFPPEMITPLLPVISSYCKFNSHKGKTTYLKSLTTQLIYVMFWKLPVQFIEILLKQNILPWALQMVFKYHKLLEERHERKRIILGILSLMVLGEKPDQLIGQMPKLFNILIKLVGKNAESRILRNKAQNQISLEADDVKEEQDSDEGMKDDNEDDDEDFWDQQFYDNYTSPLQNHDELTGFRQCMIRLQNEYKPLYQGLLQSASPKKLARVEAGLDKALNLPDIVNVYH